MTAQTTDTSAPDGWGHGLQRFADRSAARDVFRLQAGPAPPDLRGRHG